MNIQEKLKTLSERVCNEGLTIVIKDHGFNMNWTYIQTTKGFIEIAHAFDANEQASFEVVSRETLEKVIFSVLEDHNKGTHYISISELENYMLLEIKMK